MISLSSIQRWIYPCQTVFCHTSANTRDKRRSFRSRPELDHAGPFPRNNGPWHRSTLQEMRETDWIWLNNPNASKCVILLNQLLYLRRKQTLCTAVPPAPASTLLELPSRFLVIPRYPACQVSASWRLQKRLHMELHGFANIRTGSKVQLFPPCSTFNDRIPSSLVWAWGNFNLRTVVPCQKFLQIALTAADDKRQSTTTFCPNSAA